MSLLPKPSRSVAALVAGAAGTAEKVTLTTLLGLPEAVQRRLAGPPVELDGQTLAVDTQLMLRLARTAGPAIETLPIDKGRRAMLRQTLLVGGAPQRVGGVRSFRVAGPAGEHQARLYTPTSATDEPGPLLVFLHGGGFIYGDLDTHDASLRLLCEESGVRILSVEYRLAPEATFPAAYEDAVAIFDWTVEHAAALSADPARIGVGGDSAGGNLAAGVALAVTDRCAFQLLIYPVTQLEGAMRSRQLFGSGFYLTDGFMDLASSTYVPAGTDPRDPRLSPLFADVPAGVAPAFVATAGFDPLRDEGEAYATKLAEAGVAVDSWRYADQIHGFLNVLVARSSRAATADIAVMLRKGLGA